MIEFVAGKPKPPLLAGDGTPNLIHIMFTGFHTDPAGDCCGMRAQANEVAKLYPGSDFVIHSYSQDGWSESDAHRECSDIVNIIKAGNTYGQYTRIIVRGHSFGGNFATFFLNHLKESGVLIQIDIVVLLDPVPNPLQPTNWTIPMDIICAAIQFTQHNGGFWWLPIGPNGTPVADMENTGRLVSIDLTPVTNPTLYHCSLVADSRVWGAQLAMIKASMVAQEHKPVPTKVVTIVPKTTAASIAPAPSAKPVIQVMPHNPKRRTFKRSDFRGKIIPVTTVSDVPCVAADVAANPIMDTPPLPPLLPGTSWVQLSGQYPIFNGAPSIHDIHQGGRGDCYYLAVLGAMAMFQPQRLKSHIAREGKDLYRLRFRRNGVDHWVYVNGQVPSSGNVNLWDACIWPSLYEKAYAYFRSGLNTYESLDYGNPGIVMNDLGYTSGWFNPDTMGWQQAANALAQGKLVAILTSSTVNQNLVPLNPGHCVTVVSIQNGQITTYNPWGIDGVGGPTNPNNWDDGLVTFNLSDATIGNGIIQIALEFGYTQPDPFTQGSIPGDADYNGMVDLTDLTTCSGHWQQKTPWGPSDGDFDNNGTVDMTDLTILSSHWQQHK